MHLVKTPEWKHPSLSGGVYSHDVYGDHTKPYGLGDHKGRLRGAG